MKSYAIGDDLKRKALEESRKALTEEILSFIDRIRTGPRPESQLIAILQKVQKHYGYLDRCQMDAVAHLMGIPTAAVSGVATFYHFFRLSPRGRFIIRICLGTACYVKGADRILSKFRDELGIDLGETTRDGLFSLEASRCLGTCGLAPVVMVNDQVHANIGADKVGALLELYMSQNAAEKGLKNQHLP